MNSDGRRGAAALFAGVERHSQLDVSMLCGFLPKIRCRRRMGGKEEHSEQE
jgi:hypothetical protein